MNYNIINIRGELYSLEKPKVMAILNVTPDSFYANSRKQTEKEIAERVETVLNEGADMIDVGAYSSRPGAADVSPEEETERLSKALSFIAKEYPDLIISVDTFRASVARVCVEKYGVAIINDISAGEMDKDMFRTVSELNVPYIMMHMRGTPQTMKHETAYSDLMGEMMLYFSQKLNELRLLGVKDVILDPGFGFSKTLEQNYEVMRGLDEFKIFELPILVGISRKSMIYNLLGSTPEESLNGTSVLNTYALSKGASILRVHDVKAAVEVVKIMDKMNTK
jgi:dihydropteroate synthase